MSASRNTERSALGAGIMHFGMSLATFGGAAAAAAGLVAVVGDENAGGPVVEVALFEQREGPPPQLKARIDNQPAAPAVLAEGAAAPGPDISSEAGPAAASFTVTELEASAAPSANTPPSAASTLPKAPIAGFHEHTPAGELPRIAADGRTPAQAYARPFTPVPGAPRIALVVSGLGLKEEHTRAAIYDLPPDVTLSFVPYATNLQSWINKARAAGHEVLLELPMEAYDYPNVDAGPHTLLTSSSSDENVRRLNLLLGRATGYFGVINYQGARFATDAKAATPVLSALKSRGLVMLHDGAAARSVLPETAKAAGLSLKVADRVVDFDPAADSIDRELLQLEALALEKGSATGVGYAYPVTIEQLKIWTQGLRAKGYQLAPASATAGVNVPAPRGGS